MKNIFFLLAVGVVCTSNGYSKDISNLSLDDYIRDQHEYVTEGHICNGTKIQVSFFRDFFKQNPHIKNIAEIGFNAGHSSEIFLTSNPEIKVTSFDIMQHSYAITGKKYIDFRYPQRHVLISGNSLTSVPEFAKKHNTSRFDLIFIDGGHDFDTAFHDIINMKNLASAKTVLVVDDTNYPSVLNAWIQCVKDGYVTEIKRYNVGKKSWVVGQYYFQSAE